MRIDAERPGVLLSPLTVNIYTNCYSFNTTVYVHHIILKQITKGRGTFEDFLKAGVKKPAPTLPRFQGLYTQYVEVKLEETEETITPMYSHPLPPP